MNNNMIDPPRCATGCGFYGNPTQHNLCSKCFRDSLKQADVQQVQPCSTNNDNNNNNETMAMNMKKNRCCSCKKRVRLTGFECRCGEVYCGTHRYPEMHSCSFDFKGVQLEALSKTLYAEAECKADKLDYRL